MFLLKCARQQQGTDWCGYYVCDYLHIMTPCGKTTDEDMRVRPNRSLVHFHNCTNAHTTPAPLITAGSKWSSPLVLGGVGFKSLVMKGAITAGSQPGSVDPVTKQKKNCPRRCFASPRRCAACSTPTAACSHAEEEGRRGCGGEGPCAVRCGHGRGRTNPRAEHPRAELHAGPRPPARGSGRRRSSTRAPASGSRSRAPAAGRRRAPPAAVELPRTPAVELPQSSHGSRSAVCGSGPPVVELPCRACAGRGRAPARGPPRHWAEKGGERRGSGAVAPWREGSCAVGAAVGRRKGRGVNKRGSLGGEEELSGRRRSERDEKNLREMSEREEEKN